MNVIRRIGPMLLCIYILQLYATSVYAQQAKALPIFQESKSSQKSNSELIQNFDLSDHHELRAIGHDDDTYLQYYKGIPVAHTSLKYVSSSNIYSGYIYDLDIADVSPELFAYEAFAAASSELDIDEGHETLIYESEQLMIYVDDRSSEARLAYQFLLHSDAPHYVAEVYVDADTGELLAEHQHICTYFDGLTPKVARSLHNGNVFITTAEIDSNAYSLSADELNIQTYDMDGSESYTDAREIIGDRSMSQLNTAVQAHYGAEQTLNYYQYRHGRNSFDDKGATVESYINYGSSYSNAFWDGRRMSYGAGDGRMYGPIVALDISGHEISHAVIDHSADLLYSRESGALNESFADIFGEMVEYFATGLNDWQMGSEVGLMNNMTFRTMSDPKRQGDPDTYLGDYWIDTDCVRPLRSNDQCGVHTNSGVQNKWFYILSVGESGENDNGDSYDVIGINRNAAASIAYRNLTTYLHARSSYHDARQGAIQSAIDLFGAGSIQEISTTNAWYAVGVGEPYQEVAAAEMEINFELSVQDILIDGFTLHWTDANQRVDAHYEVYINGFLYASTRDLQIEIKDLVPGTAYEVQVVIRAKDGEQLYSSDVIQVVTAAPVEHASVVLSLDSVSMTDAWISWEDPQGEYSLFSVIVDGQWMGYTEDYDFHIAHLSADSEYAIWLECIGRLGSLSYSDTLTIVTEANDYTDELFAGFYFEEGWDEWTTTLGYAEHYTGEKAAEGQSAILLRQYSDMISPPISVHGGGDYRLSFDYHAWSMELRDGFSVYQSSDGELWEEIAQLRSYEDFDNYSFNSFNIEFSALADSVMYLKIATTANSKTDHIYIDAVEIFELGTSSVQFFSPLEPNDQIMVFPNPTINKLTIKHPAGSSQIKIFNTQGQEMSTHIVDPAEFKSLLDVSALHRGLYHLRLEGENADEWVRFVKL